MAALAGRLAPPQRRQDSRRGIDASEDVGEGDADLLRFALGIAGQVHDPAHTLDHEIVAGAGGIGAVLAETGDRAIDETRVQRRKARIVEPVFLEPADLTILDQRSEEQTSELQSLMRISYA